MERTLRLMTVDDVIERYYSGDYTSRDFVFSNSPKIILEVFSSNWRSEINQLDSIVSKILKEIGAVNCNKWFSYEKNKNDDSFFFVVVPKEAEQYNELKRIIEEKVNNI